MKLYYAPGACSLAPHIVSREAGITLDLVKVDLAAKTTEDGGDYWQINPKGYVPALALDEGGDVLTEAGVICQYLADRRPESGLMAPAGSLARYHQLEALNFVATEMHKQLGALFNPAMTPEMKEVQKGTIARRLDALEKLLEGRDYLAGDRFGAVDAYLFTVLNWAGTLQIDLSKRPNIQAFVARVRARPKVQEAMHIEGLIGQQDTAQ